MTTVPSPQTTTISAYASPRIAPRPRVIPLFATTLRFPHRRAPGIHMALPVKPIYHPYPRSKRGVVPNGPPGACLSANSTSENSTMPASPLTPMDDEFPSDTSSQVETQGMFIPPPSGTLAMSSLDVHGTLTKKYRVRAY